MCCGRVVLKLEPASVTLRHTLLVPPQSFRVSWVRLKNSLKVLACLTSNQVTTVSMVLRSHFGILVCEDFLQESSSKCLFHSWTSEWMLVQSHISLHGKGNAWWWWFNLSVMSNSCDPMDWSPPGSSVHEMTQARILELVAIPFSGDLPGPGTEPMSHVLQAMKCM